MTSTSKTERGSQPLRRWSTALITIGVLGAAMASGLFIGGQSTSPWVVLGVIRGDVDIVAQALVVEIRLPRTLAAAIAGIGLGLAASLLQTLTRNPVADAGLLGANAGATVMIAFGIATGMAADFVAQSAWALLGALTATILVSAVGLSGRIYSATRLVLFGVALGAVLTGITTGLMLAVPEAFDSMRSWLSGSMVGVAMPSNLTAAMLIGLSLIVALAVSRALELTLMGDDVARALGARLLPTRATTVLAVALASAAATALVGPIGFVGLLGAHLAAATAQRLALPAALRHLVAAAGGGALLVLADLVGRIAFWPGELPAGIVVAAIGSPFLLLIIRRNRSLT